MTGSERAYRCLIRLLPSGLRKEAELELVETFRQAQARAAARGRWALLAFWIQMAADVFAAAAAERLATRGGVGRTLIQVWGDLGPSARRLARTPVWTLTSAGTLGLGLAASVVGIVLVRDVLLRPLPFPHPDRLVRIVELSDGGRSWWPSFPNAADWRDDARMFSGVGIADIPRVQPVWIGDRAMRVRVTRVARGFFDTLGGAPEIGRWFTAEENRLGGAAVAVVSDGFWRGELGGRPLGELSVTIGQERYQVVGVLPPFFRFLGDGATWEIPAEVWTPMDRDRNLGSRSSHGYHVVARLADGVTLDRARTEMNQLATVLKRQHHEPTQADAVLLTPLTDVVIRTAREPLSWLLYAGAVVLLVSCLNLAAAILAQGLTRGHELAVRLALGATRASLARHLVVEALLLAVPGTIVGLALASSAFRVIRQFALGALPRLDEIGLDGDVLMATVGLSLFTACIAGLIPAILLSGATADRLRGRGVIAGSRDHRRVWGSFVAAQVALTVLLLCATGLLSRSLVAALSVDLGYNPSHVLAIDVTLPAARYENGARRVAFYDAALQRVRATPGVAAAGLTSVLPEDTSASTSETYSSETDLPVKGQPTTFAGFRVVDAGYFDAIGIGRVRDDGRGFADGGAAIDRRVQSVLWPHGDPMGERLINGFSDVALRVSAIVGTVREWNQGDDTTGAVYVDFHRRPDALQDMHLIVRSRLPGPLVATAVRQVFASVDPLVPVSIDALESRTTEGLKGRRLLLVLAVGFGAVALLLAVVSVYSLVAFVVGRQRRESAIRLALGARPAALRRRVVVRGVMPAVAGVAIGLAGSVPLGEAIRAQLFNVRPSDPLVLSAAALAVVAAACLAALVPARRVARVEPAQTLRAD